MPCAPPQPAFPDRGRVANLRTLDHTEAVSESRVRCDAEKNRQKTGPLHPGRAEAPGAGQATGPGDPCGHGDLDGRTTYCTRDTGIRPSPTCGRTIGSPR